MPKYYVDSGELSFVCSAREPTEAITRAIAACPDGAEIGAIIRVNEEGHSDIEHDTDVYMATLPLLASLDEEDLMDMDL